ncbi:dsDNA nuclease domain-containing protein [Sphingomonas sp. PP-CE-1G-424]|uniref:dsDNA nuclease domain-containing protein n=1 Tax=Sphingomonas sp. PP-CE-1G-424 TaxID=2135658 RepID=UPI001055337B
MSSETETLENDEEAWPSIDDAHPSEEGGPIARKGFNYQDEIAVGFVLEMLANPQLAKIHFETHDDLVLVWAIGAPPLIAEFVQVKGAEADKLWSVADLCLRKKQAVGSSIFEKSLDRDQHEETARFRIVTLRPVVSDLTPLTYARGNDARALDCGEMVALKADLDGRMPGVVSQRGNGTGYWLDNCQWDARHDEAAVKTHNRMRLFEIMQAAGKPLLLEHMDILLDELRKLVKTAGDAKWKPDKAKKILIRKAFLAMWDACLAKLKDDAAQPSGGKLVEKMSDAYLTGTVVAMAVDMRLDYARSVRTSRYMQPDEAGQLQGRVKSEVQTLSARRAAGTLDLDGPAFHALCVDRMDAINASLPADQGDRSAFLKGCMYDIADRCLLRFDRTGL